ncbi:MAG: hypothetical protein F6K08_07790 [Okeania sp. SIO1H6]|nr:hypothetical protein [Okeania sp. SIO1H6]
MERYGLDIKALIRDVINGNQIEIEKYCYKLKNIASDFFDEEDDPTWLNLIKAEIEKLEDFKVSHDEVDLTVTHYGTNVGSIHYNQYDELEIEQKLIGELAKYNFDLEAFLVAENIPYKLYHPKPVVVTQNQTSEHTKKSPTGSSNGNKTGSNVLNKNETELDTVYIQEPCTITKIRHILATVAPEICFTDDGINMVAWHNGKDLGSINVPGHPLWITYSSNLEEYLKNNCRFNLSSFVEDIEKGNLNGLPFSDLIKKLKNGNQNYKYFDSNITKNNLPVPSPTKNLDILDKLAQVFKSIENIHTERSGDRLSFYQGKIYLDSCDMMRYLDGKAPSLFPSFKLKEKLKELFAIDLAKLCFDLETGKSIDINDYLNQSICQHTNTESSNIHETNSSQDTLKPSDTESCQHSEGLHWVEYKSIYSRVETYVVWHGTQECGKIYRRNKRKGKQKANIGKWYVSPNVLGPYYDTIPEAATACWEDFVSRNGEQTETEVAPTEPEEELIPF